MFSKALTSLAAVALLATTVRADYSIIEPVEGTKWVPGEAVTISWIEVPGTTTPAKISLALMVGDPALLQVSEIIASDVDSSAGTYKWTVPGTIQPSTQYAVRAGNGDTVKYSHYFNVQGDDTAQVNASAVGSSSEATSASQTSSAGTPASSGTSVSVPVTASTSSVFASGSSSAAVSGASKASVSPSGVSPSSVPTGTPSKPSGASSSTSGGSAKSSSSANSSPSNTGENAGNALTISGIAALIPAALVAFLRQ